MRETGSTATSTWAPRYEYMTQCLEQRKNWEEVHLVKCVFICSRRQSLVVPLCL